jgi:hypothetical protein
MKLIKISRQFGIAIWLMALCAPFLVYGDLTNATMKYRGFTIDESLVQNLTNLQIVLTATEKQIDIVCAVGVPARMLTFFQSQPIHLQPSNKGGGGDYEFRTKKVNIDCSDIVIFHKPILLHEFLHALHNQRLPRGFENPRIKQFYEHAKSLNVYDAKSHMMSNDKEFFACSGTTYLFGVTAQEPFKREKIRENQPQYFEFLQKLFGTNAGTYKGSLTP